MNKNTGETQNRAVAQPLVVGRTTTTILMFAGGGCVAPVFAQTVTLAAESSWFTSIDWVDAARTVVYFLLTLCGLAALGWAAWMGIHYVGDAFQKASSHIRQKNEGTRIKMIQDDVVRGNQELETLVQRAQLALNDAGVLAEQRLQMFLTSTHSGVDHMKSDLERMKYYPGILPKFNQSEGWFWIVTFGLLGEFVLECAANIVLLGQGASWLDAGVFAVFFAGLNILGGFLSGRVIKWMWQKVNHAAAFSVGAVMVGLGFYIAAIFGKFRDIYVNGHGDSQPGDFDAATKLVREEVFPPSVSTFIYTDITSFIPFVLAIIFFVLAVMGTWKIYDPYREMRIIERRLKEVYKRQEKALNNRIKNFKSDLRKWPDDIAKNIQQQERKIASGQGELGKFDPQGPNVKAANVARELLSVAREQVRGLRDSVSELGPKVDKGIRAVDAHGKKVHTELFKIHRDIADFTTPRRGVQQQNSHNGGKEMKEPTL